MRHKKLLRSIMDGRVTTLCEVGGKGSHRVYARREVAELLTLQEADGQAKPYQVRQVVTLIRRSNLELEGKP